MKIDILTLFPEMFEPLKHSILERAQTNGILEINFVNIRDFSADKHKKVDDTPFGGMAGMIMTCQPLFNKIKNFFTTNSKFLYMSPKRKLLEQKKVVELSSC